jgi:muconolactone delta-isomerase
MGSYLRVATFRPGTEMDEVMAVVAEEQARIRTLVAEGRMGAIHLSMARQTVFLEVFADDEAGAEATVRTLPMSAWWDLDLFPLSPPASPA